MNIIWEKQMAGIKILGYGLSRGDEKVTNLDLEKKVDTKASA